MAQFGWFLYINRDGCKDSTLEEKKYYFEDCFKKIEPLLINGLRFASKQEYIGTACVVGPDEECLRLKQQIEQMGIGSMIPDKDYIRPLKS